MFGGDFVLEIFIDLSRGEGDFVVVEFEEMSKVYKVILGGFGMEVIFDVVSRIDVGFEYEIEFDRFRDFVFGGGVGDFVFLDNIIEFGISVVINLLLVSICV